MKGKLGIRLWTAFFLTAVLILPLSTGLSAQQDKVAAFKQALGQNQKMLHQYQWIETTTVSVKGDEKSQVQKQCSYGPDGKVQKVQISAPPEQQSGRGLKGRIIAKKEEEMTDYMKQAAALIHEYVPPDSERIQAAKDSGKLTLSPMGQGALRLDFHDYLKPSDTLSINLNTANLSIQRIDVNSYLDSPSDPITLDVTFATLNDGVSYPANSVLNAPAKKIQVVIQNANYQRMTAATQPPAQGAQSGATQAQANSNVSQQQIDTLTAPIALYPDALLAQMLTASTNFFELQSFAGWMSKNTNLSGSALQDAAHTAGYDPCFVALAPFPQVVQMMVQKPDWTKQLGQLFAANKNAVFESIQRLRAQAKAVGNLQTTSQQQVQVQTTSTGQEVIVIQPANPQVVYVPTYNPQVVYVQAPPPSSSTSSTTAAVVGFTAGVIIGAAASNNYYYGPYAWHGGAMYSEAWNTRYNYAHDLQQNRYNNASNLQQNRYNNASNLQSDRQNYANQRQNTYQQNASQRQSTSQANQTQRQSAAQTNQSQRQTSATSAQSNAQANQAQRQSSASTAQSNRQAQQGQRQNAASTSSLGSGQGFGQRSGMSSGGFSGYQGSASTRAQSARGNSSLSGGGGRSGGGRSGGGRFGGGGGGGRRR